MIPAIVFSRDRACQLDLLLTSLERNAPEMFKPVVLWKFTAPHFLAGYERCIQDHLDVEFEREDSLTYQVRHFLRRANPTVVFFTDDDVLYRPLAQERIHERALDNEDVLCFSLRLGVNTTVCYPHNRAQRLPSERLLSDMLLWRWSKQDGDFGYPMSLDGHIFRADDIRPLVDQAHFTTPNFLEDALVRGLHNIQRQNMASFRESHLVSIPANKVSESHAGNRFGQNYAATTEELNAAYINGGRIALEEMDFSSVRGAHHELPYALKVAA